MVKANHALSNSAQYAKIEKVRERLYWQVEVNRFLLSKE